MFCGTDDIHRQSNCLHAWDPAEHLHFINLCNLRMLERFRHSRQVLAVYLWNPLSAGIILGDDNYGWRITLNQAKYHVLYECG